MARRVREQGQGEDRPVDSVAVSTKGAEGTGAVAALLAPHLRPGDVVLLTGGLASGKTTFVKAVAAALGSAAPVTSPTFTIAHFYPYSRGTVLHIDAYRLSGVHEYRDLGLSEYLEEALTLVEWGEKVAGDFPCHLAAELQCDDSAPDVRMIAFSSGCPRWQPVISALQADLLGQAQPGRGASR
jgi:tRNA threonylcarbamoyladenosine biosynthesis protein TsaE